MADKIIQMHSYQMSLNEAIDKVQVFAKKQKSAHVKMIEQGTIREKYAKDIENALDVILDYVTGKVQNPLVKANHKKYLELEELLHNRKKWLPPEIKNGVQEEYILRDKERADQILKIVSRHLGVSIKKIKGRRRFGPIAEARTLCYYLLWTHLRTFNKVQTGRYMNRDHSSVYSGIKQVRNFLEVDRSYAEMVATIQVEIEKILSDETK